MTYDFIIVGAGSAGCVLANRLSADPSNRVLLLEAGGWDINPWIHVPVGYFKTLHNPKTDWCYKTEPDPGLNGRSIDWPRGKTLGGSSSINGMLYIRGQRQDYDTWAQLGNKGWSYDDVLALFKRSESYEQGETEYHGSGGGLAVNKTRAKSPISEAFIDAAVEMGVPRTDDVNGPTQEGVDYFPQTAKNGFRCSSARAFLHPIRGRANLDIVTHAHTQKLKFSDDDPNRVTGVDYLRKGSPQTAEVKPGGEVILSAGAIGSPQIMELSGIGKADVLKAAGVNLRHELPGVGECLQDHLQIRLVYEVNVPTLNDAINNFFHRMGIGVQYVLTRTGPMSIGRKSGLHFRQVDGSAGDTGHSVPFPAAERGQTRHRHAPLFRHHLLRLPVASGKPWTRSHRNTQRCGSSQDRAELFVDQGRSGLRRPGGEVCSRHDQDQRA